MSKQTSTAYSTTYTPGKSPLFGDYVRARRWNLGKRSQTELAEAAAASQCDLSSIETGNGHNVQTMYILRLAQGLWLLETRNLLNEVVKVRDAEDNRRFWNERYQAYWHEVNRCSVTAGKGLMIHDGEVTLEDVQAEIEAEIREAEKNPEFQRRQAVCAKLRWASLKRRKR